jgi:hypothetical protein
LAHHVSHRPLSMPAAYPLEPSAPLHPCHRPHPALKAPSTLVSCVVEQVGIIMGSDSDLPTMKAAAQVLEDFGVVCEVSVVSAHRTPERMMEYAHTAHKRGIKVIIAGAGARQGAWGGANKVMRAC